MADTKVLVVDDSLTMRALISRVLDTLPGIQVVGMADGADEARAEIPKLKPDVITLDVEMPGMSGIEYLAELMEERPLPVIMFSTKTAAGASSSIEALRLGAIDCFPKPKAATQGEFDAILGKLGNRIRAAKNMVVKPGKLTRATSFEWNGRMLTIGMDASGTRKLFDLLGSFPANCPPTLVVPHIPADLVDSLIEQLNAHAAPTVVKAEGVQPQQGTVYVTRPGDAHVGMDQWPGGTIRRLTKDPIDGERPAISILFACQARAATSDTVAVMLTEAGEDGKMGIGQVLKAGGHVLAPRQLLGASGAGPEYSLRKGDTSEDLTWEQMATRILTLCAK